MTRADRVQCAAKALYQGDSAGVCRSFCVSGFVGQVRGNGAIDYAQHFAHDEGLAGKQKAQRERDTEYPLTHGLMRQGFVHQQGSTVRHSKHGLCGDIKKTRTGTMSAVGQGRSDEPGAGLFNGKLKPAGLARSNCLGGR